MEMIDKVIEKKNGGRPEKILQFGEGNFLRAFADWMIDKANSDGLYNGSVVLCQPIAQGLGDTLNAQDCVYTVAMRGRENGKAVENMQTVTSVSRCINPYKEFGKLMEVARSPELEVIISNTTEAGIAYHAGDSVTDTPPVSFPAKLTVVLYERYKAFSGNPAKGLLILPCELIDNNGANLERIVFQYIDEWKLEPAFRKWVEENIHFTSTLVDRIVTGYPRDSIADFESKLGYRDNALVTCELFNLWVIEGKKEWADILPIHRTDAHVIWTDNVKPYKARKVRILNGSHTSTVLAAYLANHDTVLDYMNDDIFRSYMHDMIFDEIIPTLDLPRPDMEAFAREVEERYANPYVKHRLLDISLNSCAKFNARSLPSILIYKERMGSIPRRLSFSMAAFIAFYRGKMKDGKYMGVRADGLEYQIRDDDDVLSFFAEVWKSGDPAAVTKAVLSHSSFWSGRDLTAVEGLEEAVSGYLSMIVSADNIESVVQKLK